MLRRKQCSAKAQALKTSVPYGSAKVEYLESTGNQILDTNYFSNNNTKYVFKCKIDKFPQINSSTSDYKNVIFLLASRDINNDNHTLTITSYSDNRYYLRWGATNTIENHNLNKNNVLTYTFNNSALNVIDEELNEVFNLSIVYSDINPSFSTTIFRALPNLNDDYNLKYYYFTIFEENSIIQKLIPAVDRTGTPCMFDLVSRKNFYNAGTGDFLYPSPTSSTTYSLRRPQAEWAKMTDTGVHKIYHTPIGYEGSLEDYAIENGYKTLIETESPNEEGKYYAFRWIETDDTLTTEWFEVEPPQEIIP